MSRLLIVCVWALLCGCSSFPSLSALFPGSRESAIPMQELSYAAADRLHGQMERSDAAAYPMLAATFVDAANVDATSDVGRLVSSQIASRLSQLGYSVSEIQLRTEQMAVRPEGGVFALSRNVAHIQTDVQAYAVLVGTYTVVDGRLYINARVVRTGDGVALASTDFSMPRVRDSGASGGGNGAVASVRTRLN